MYPNGRFNANGLQEYFALCYSNAHTRTKACVSSMDNPGFRNFANKTYVNRIFAIGESSPYFQQFHCKLDIGLKKTFLSYIEQCKQWYIYIYIYILITLTSLSYINLVCDNLDSSFHFHQHIVWNFAHWKNSIALSPMANVLLTNIPPSEQSNTKMMIGVGLDLLKVATSCFAILFVDGHDWSQTNRRWWYGETLASRASLLLIPLKQFWMAPTTFKINSLLMQEDNLVDDGDCNRIMILNIKVDWISNCCLVK